MSGRAGGGKRPGSPGYRQFTTIRRPIEGLGLEIAIAEVEGAPERRCRRRLPGRRAAPTSGRRGQDLADPSGPRIEKAVERASASAAVGASTVTLAGASAASGRRCGGRSGGCRTGRRPRTTGTSRRRSPALGCGAGACRPAGLGRTGCGTRDLPATAEAVRRRADGVEARLAAVDQGRGREPVGPDQLGERGPGRTPCRSPPKFRTTPGRSKATVRRSGSSRTRWRAGSGSGVGQFVGRRDPLRPLDESPGQAQGPGGEVVGPAGLRGRCEGRGRIRSNSSRSTATGPRWADGVQSADARSRRGRWSVAARWRR